MDNKKEPIPHNCTTCSKRISCHNGRGKIIAWRCGEWTPQTKYKEERRRFEKAVRT